MPATSASTPLAPRRIVGSLVRIIGAACAGGPGSRSMKAACAFIELHGKPLSDPALTQSVMQDRAYPTPPPVPARLRRKAAMTERTIDGWPLITLAPKSAPSRWHILYLHGGAYVSELARPHWDIVGALIAATGAHVHVPIYPLAPEHDHRRAFDVLLSVYRDLLTTTPADTIVIAGDSAGGGLALGLALALREAGLPAPARVIAFAPWLDLTLADPAIRAEEARDPMLAIDPIRLCGTWWAGAADPRTPRLSPLYADPHQFPPVDIYQGDRDLLVVDVRSLVARAEGAIGYREYPGAFHVFMAATFTPEAKDVYRRVRQSLGG